LTSSLRERAERWDAGLRAIRAWFASEGFLEVHTDVRVEAVALEPFIEPIPLAGGFLRTSPELALKRMLAEGVGKVFEIAPVFRRAERGRSHREGFHLIEWYRDEPDARRLQRDVEELVAAVFAVADERAGRKPGDPPAFDQVEFLALAFDALGVELRGDEPASLLAAPLADVRRRLSLPLPARVPDDPRARDLAAWLELQSGVFELGLAPLLERRSRRSGIHLVEFPRALAALAELAPDGRTARRFESHVGVLELANAYVELRDPEEQRARFATVAALRDGSPLPIDERFLRALPRMPPCAGAAMGFERLLMAAFGEDDIADVVLE
jgi:lysyl-tRNA synthetase class 2